MLGNSACRFLFLDPDEDFLETMESFAKKRSAYIGKVQFTRDVRPKLLEIIQSNIPDVIVIHLDHDNEEHFGDCVREIHSVPLVPPPIVVGITDRTDQFLVQKAFEAGVDDYLVRPCVPMTLWLKLDVWARIRSLQRSFDLATRRLSTLNAKLSQSNHRLEELSVTDELTGLSNMRFMTQALEKHFTLLQRYERPFSIIMLDLDHFKSVNDDNDHLVGSAMIKSIGAVIDACTRNTDIKARYGGDEYIIAMPETGENSALVVAERLRESIFNNVLDFDDDLKVRVTASIGVASYQVQRHRSFTELIKDADRAMYLAKEGGRNRVCQYDPKKTGGYDESQSTIMTAVKKLKKA
ncbi:diguanylate cyclase [bacterium]|nr:diguanylate cyclase [bacterium]